MLKHRLRRSGFYTGWQECYRLINDTKNAEITYGTLVRNGFDRKNSMVLLYYADAQRANEKYDEAKDNYELFMKAEPKTLEAGMV